MFLPDRLPAYVSWDQFERIQAQIRSNRQNEKGPARAGSALLSGLVVCGVCGLRMTSSYNNNGQTARYVCNGMRSSSNAPLCQSLQAASVDAEVTRLVLQALEPAAIDISLAVASDFVSERIALDRQWHQRLERAQQEVDQARRQYARVEPENRLVARTLERTGAASPRRRTIVDHDRFQRERPQAPSRAELAAIRNLTEDLPTLWHAATTTQKERQEIARLLLERVVVKVINHTEHAILECHWQGGNRTVHKIVRPVARAAALSSYPALIARLRELHQQGRTTAQIADTLNQEGWRPPKRRDTYRDMVLPPAGLRRHCHKPANLSRFGRQTRRVDDQGTRRPYRHAAADPLLLGPDRPPRPPRAHHGRQNCQADNGGRGDDCRAQGLALETDL